MELEEKQQKTEVAPDSLTEPTSSQPEEMFAQTDPGVLLQGMLARLNTRILTVDDYEPDQLARQMSQVNWSSFMTKSELAAAMDQLPIEMLSDESQLEYERNHLPAEAWPPTGWFINWASGRDLFGFDNVKPPMELRWLVFKRL